MAADYEALFAAMLRRRKLDSFISGPSPAGFSRLIG